MDLSEARGLVLCWVIRGGMRDYTEAECQRHWFAYEIFGCSPSNPSVSRTDRPPPENMLEMNELFPWGRSGSLRLQFLSVEVVSLLPQSQRDRCNLARQRQPHHGWLDAFGE